MKFNTIFNIALSTTALISKCQAENYSTYPSVPHTASINGFADPIYDLLPTCAQTCVSISTDITPCPYWDTGCLCVITTFASSVADCIAESCYGNDVVKAVSLAKSLCNSVGAGTWVVSSTIDSELSVAATATAVITTFA